MTQRLDAGGVTRCPDCHQNVPTDGHHECPRARPPVVGPRCMTCGEEYVGGYCEAPAGNLGLPCGLRTLTVCACRTLCLAHAEEDDA